MNLNRIFAYRKAWKALNTMLEEGRSYSGFERNCAFLNLGGGQTQFADISGACGLDLMDDGRAIAVTDWDFDGKLDFWISNRTAPRIRLQHNRSQTRNNFVSVRLIGKSCNRDAVGARVELLLEGTPSKQMLTLRAGEGFLAQSSKWIHFGIADGAQIKDLKVLWPGGKSEKIAGVEPGHFFIVEQGSGKAHKWQVPAKIKPLQTIPVVKDPVSPSESARIVMASRLPFPEASYLELDGKRTTAVERGRPRLINLWATWCAPCVAEMDSWTKKQAALRELGIDILALSVDKLDNPVAERRAIVKPFLEKRKFPFAVGLADAGFLEVLEVAGRAQIDKYESLPVPSSILLDAKGRIAVIYKGPVEVKRLATDVALLGATKEVLNVEAAHFQGTWIEGPWPATPTGMLDKFMSFGQPEAAKNYLDQFTVSGGERANRDLAESYFIVGSELRFQKNFNESIKAFAHAIKLDSKKTRARLELATLLFRMQRYIEALPHLRKVVTEQPQVHNTRKMLSLSLIQTNDHTNAARHLNYLSSVNPDDAMAKLWYGHSLVRLGRATEAEQLFREALSLQPGSLLVINELAWLLATHTDTEIYNPIEALKLAVQCAKASKKPNLRVLDTLAAAQAANGDFVVAVKTIDAAIGLALAAKDKTMIKLLQGRREGYLEKRPYRETLPVYR